MDRVLVVDDETGIRGLIAQWVESLGCAPVEAGNAEHALERLAEARCAVAVCDVNLPGHDGLWLARQIRLTFPDTAIVLGTGTRDLESAVSGLRAGIVDYLVKPFGRERFREAMDRARQWHRVAAEALRWRRSVEAEFDARLRQLSEAIVRLNPADDDAVRGTLALLTVRNRPAYDHALRVAALATELAEVVGLATADRAHTERAALVHEVARTVVPETVLWKPGDLTPEEWGILRREPEIGYDLFTRVPFLGPAGSLLRCARERFDGTGYPRGLAGPAIPAGARVLAVADAYDTMTRPLGHRDPLTPSQAAEELAGGRGSQFDPAVADALLEILGHACHV
jgi:response regulator RpfG family c-di-GMP phosphodiesterase